MPAPPLANPYAERSFAATARRWIGGAMFAFACTSSLSAAADDATVWYVRADGGDAQQCDGRHDAAYPGHGSAQPCAWNHPFVALPPLRTPRIAGGDTLHIGTGDYMMGIGAPETSACSAAASRHCHMPPLPAGPSPDRPTRLLGAGHDRGCRAPPQLWGSERAEMVLNLQGSSNVELACLQVTDRAACIEHHCNSGTCGGEVAACNKDGPPFGPWAYAGLVASDASHVRLRDIEIHGMAAVGVRAGRVADVSSERLVLRANGWAGWDGDLGDGDSANRGDIVFREAHIAWNGCAERYPEREVFGCWAGHGGGYGDGIGVAESGGDWLFEDSIVSHNTSDGIDLLYLRGDASVTVRRSWIEGNAGNALKTSGDLRLENSVIVGNCGYFAAGQANMGGTDHCRSLGNTLSLGLAPGTSVDVVNNTISGQGDCLLLTSGGDATARVNVVNNVLIGERDWLTPTQRTCLHYSLDDRATLSWERNLVTGVKNGACPPDSLCVTDAPIANRDPAAFDPTPLPGGPLIDAANPARAPRTDFFNRTRDVGLGPDIGSVEYGTHAAGGDPPAARTLRVASVQIDVGQAAGPADYVASVRVVDGNGLAAADVFVIGKWRGVAQRFGAAHTDAAGVAVIHGGAAGGRGSPAFCAIIADPGIDGDRREVCGRARAQPSRR